MTLFYGIFILVLKTIIKLVAALLCVHPQKYEFRCAVSLLPGFTTSKMLVITNPI